MRAELFAIGTEILLGEIVDSNSAYVAGRLPALGCSLYRITQLGDNLDRITTSLKNALAINDLVITTGGLGPTDDDMTRAAIAAAFDETPTVDADLAQHLKDWFARRKVVMPERNLKQAWLIPSAVSMPNHKGTAPGWWVEKNGKRLACLPGPPAEMRPMWEGFVEPRLGALAHCVIVTRTLKTVGVGEGKVDELISSWFVAENPTVGVYTRGDGIHVRLGARADTRVQAEAIIAPVEAAMRDVLGTALWGVDEDTLQDSVMNCLAAKRLTLAVAEDSVTGGAVSGQLTLVDTEVRRQVWRGSDVWPVSAGASIEAALSRSHVARSRHDSRIGLGIAVDEPSGTLHIAVSDADGDDRTSFTFPQALPAMRARVSTSALALLRKRYCL